MFGTSGVRRRTSGRGLVVRRIAPLPAAALVAWVAAIAPSGAAGSVTVAEWRMDEPAGARVLVDAGPSGLDGQIGSSIAAGVVEQGAIAHRFSPVAPDSSPVDPERLDVVPHDERLDPGTGDYAMTVRLRTTSPQGNVVQKGQSAAVGGYMKIDMDEGRVACVYLGSAGSSHVRSAESVADGAWHELRCVRTANEVVLSIDGAVVDRQRGATGEVANEWPVTIAGKGSCNQVTVGCDYFSGDIDRVLMERSGEPFAPPTTAPPTTVPPTLPPTTLPPTGPAPTVPVTTAAPTTTVRPPTTTVRPSPTTTTTTVPEVVK